MTGTLIVDTVRNTANSVSLSTTNFNRRLLQRTFRWFRGGMWTPSNTWYEVPGSWLSITPIYSNSFLTYTWMCPLGHRGAAHSISHWIFMADGKEYARHTVSIDHQEQGAIRRWEVPSWGAGRSASMGYITRQYAESNHSVHFNARRYIDGSDSNRSVPSWVSVEEYTAA